MSEENKPEDQQKKQGDQQQNNQQQGDQQPGPVPYDRFKQVNDDLKKARELLDELERKQKEADDKRLADDANWKELAEKRGQELEQERLARLRLTVAAKKGIPVELVDRLRGGSEDEMEADADVLLAHLKPAEGPGVPPAKKKGGKAQYDLNSMTPKQIREKKDEIWRQEVG